MLPKESSLPSCKSESSNFGGVAVLAELPVIVRSRVASGAGGSGGVEFLVAFIPKDNVRPAARSVWKLCDSVGGGGTGIS